ncbi:hypothetical protein THAOC_07064 [Thalassiosira oceanica]|uniref:Uncharacterized protein n=1 Tax=Thalassiosira oceanica TaxID=159749 RepID=K0SYI2_THAOC|nr:hypothetical protein THAOC_07064 [Thalassiosira oceanica]|eukprot:EJK71488.1 hypothetical protein THAOC_07064 [Thalassiosira oceanica]
MLPFASSWAYGTASHHIEQTGYGKPGRSRQVPKQEQAGLSLFGCSGRGANSLSRQPAGSAAGVRVVLYALTLFKYDSVAAAASDVASVTGKLNATPPCSSDSNHVGAQRSAALSPTAAT